MTDNQYTIEKEANGHTETITLWYNPDGTGQYQWETETTEGIITHINADKNEAHFHTTASLFDTDGVDGLKLPADTTQALINDKEAAEERKREQREARIAAEKEEPLSFEAEIHRYNAGVDWPTSALVLKPSKRHLSDDQTDTVDILKRALDTAGNYITAPDGTEEGDTYALEELKELAGEDYQAAVDGVEAEREAERERQQKQAQKKAEQQALKDSFEEIERDQWEEGSGEAHAIKAKVTLRDTTTDREETYRVRNAVDIGYQAWREDAPDPITDYLEADNWLTVQGTVIDTWAPDQDSITQKGIIEADGRGDDTREIEYVIWSSTSLDPLEKDTEYRLISVVTNTHNDELYLSLNKNTTVTPLTDIDIEAEQDFDERVRKYLRKFGPVTTRMRMAENDGRNSGRGAPRRPQGRGGY